MFFKSDTKQCKLMLTIKFECFVAETVCYCTFFFVGALNSFLNILPF